MLVIYPDLSSCILNFNSVPLSGAPINLVYKVRNVINNCVILEPRRLLLDLDRGSSHRAE